VADVSVECPDWAVSAANGEDAAGPSGHKKESRGARDGTPAAAEPSRHHAMPDRVAGRRHRTVVLLALAPCRG